MKTNLNKEIEKLKINFYNIQCRNWILSRGKGTGAAGSTFEFLLGKEDDRYSLPDFNGIEIKTKYQNSIYPIALFSMAPDNKPLEIERLLNICGYPDKKNSKFKIFNNTFYGNYRKEVGFVFSYQLIVDYKCKKVRLAIYSNNHFFDKDISWSFKELESRLRHKLSYLALVHVRKEVVNNNEYFKYDDITFYILKDFNTFLSLIEKGSISVTFKISYFKDEERYGKIHDHGTHFSIFEKDLLKLFDLVDEDHL